MIHWSCNRCGTSVPQDCALCIKCGFDPSVPPEQRDHYPPADCLRCQSPMQSAGTLQLHEGTRMWPVLMGNIGELLVDRRRFETFLCSGCGKVEFFMSPEPYSTP